jgi:hypothetical protein
MSAWHADMGHGLTGMRDPVPWISPIKRDLHALLHLDTAEVNRLPLPVVSRHLFPMHR